MSSPDHDHLMMLLSVLTSLRVFSFLDHNPPKAASQSINSLIGLILIFTPHLSTASQCIYNNLSAWAAEKFLLSYKGSWRFCLALFSECGIVEQGGVVEGLLKITSEEGRGDVSSDTLATFCFLPLSLNSIQSPVPTTVVVNVCESGVTHLSLTHTHIYTHTFSLPLCMDQVPSHLLTHKSASPHQAGQTGSIFKRLLRR